MFLLVDKPLGWSSFDVVAYLKHLLPQILGGSKKIKIGHGGTLDPGATGVLIIATDTDTKKLPLFLAGNKKYHASFEWGRMTDTWDSYPWNFDKQYEKHHDGLGWIVNDNVCYVPSYEHRATWIGSLQGTIVLPLPPFRASKRQGQPLYKQARKERFDASYTPTYKESRINHITPHTYDGQTWSIDCEVSGGTYIRSFAWLAYMHFGIPCVMKTLRRTGVATTQGRWTLQTQGDEYTTDKLSYRIINTNAFD